MRSSERDRSSVDGNEGCNHYEVVEGVGEIVEGVVVDEGLCGNEVSNDL